MSPVGTNKRTNVNAFAPDSSLRVLIAMLVRSDSTGAPSLWWYLPAASAAAVRNAVFNLPPSARDASIISRYGARNVSVCRCNERCVHNGERAGSTVLSSATSPRTVAAA